MIQKYMKRMRRMGIVSIAGIFAVTMTGTAAVYAEEDPAGQRQQITEEFISLLDEDPELQELVEKSIRLAAVNNPDPETNPVQSLEDYYDFLDWSATCMPWNILDGQDTSDLYSSIDQSLDYFYYLLDQPLPELAGKGLYYPCLEYYEPIASWCKVYASFWGEFLSTEESWNDEFYQLVVADEAFGMDKGWYADTNVWTSFNDWFSRELKDEGQRPISDADIIAPADSTPQGIWEIDENSQIDMGVQLKSTRFYNVGQIIGEDSAYKDEFANGILTHTFLDVNDYHRYHFPVSGTILEVRKIDALDAVGGLIAWSSEEDRYLLYDENPGWQSVETRDCVIMDTEFGLVAILPIGMSQVSSCNWEDSVQVGAVVEKGDPMGYFLFGGSDIVMIFQEGVQLELASSEHILMGEPYAEASMTEEVYDADADPLLQGVAERAQWFNENHLGYPLNEDIEMDDFYDWYLRNEVGHAMMNNAGDPNEIGANHGALEVEAEVIRFFAPFYGFDPDDVWGLISASGTDGNNHGIYFGRHYLTDKTDMDPILYVSTESHYSNKRLAELQQLEVRLIDTDEMGRMIPESFREALDPDRPALVVFSMGTTFKGGIDDQQAINAILDEVGPPAVYRHVDAALFGGYLPFSEYAAMVDRKVCGFDSIAVSGHKFFGIDEPCGLFFTTKEVMEHQNPYDISYLEGSMPMVNCSRSALNPLKFYWIIKHFGVEGFTANAEIMLENTAYLKEKLDEMGWPAWVSDECSNTVFFTRPDDDIMEKYFLAPDYDERFGGDLAHVIVMPNVDKELLDRFLDDLQAAAEQEELEPAA